MPLRGSLFRQIKKVQANRKKAEQARFKKEVKKEAALLKKLRKKSIQEGARSLLRGKISEEKAKIKALKKPSKAGKIEKFLAKKAIKGIKKLPRPKIKVRRPKIRFSFG